jgi:hypothetical protein
VRFFTFVHTPYYETRARKLLTDDDQRHAEEAICENPLGDGPRSGIRKIRIPLKGKGKRGGARILYYLKTSKDTVLLLDAYAKNVKESLSAAEELELKELTRIWEAEL